MIEAFPVGDGTFRLRDGYPYLKYAGTYAHKEKIKAAGGHWSAENKCWIVTEEALPSLKSIVTRMRKARVAAVCHNPEEVCYVTEQDVERGTHKRGCSRCDRSYACGSYAEILEVLE